MLIKNKLILGFVLLFSLFFSLLFSASSFAGKPLNIAAPTDIAITNQSKILYWLEKRGELASNATEAEKQQAIAQYMGNKNAQPIKLTGEMSLKVAQAKQKILAKTHSRILDIKNATLQQINNTSTATPVTSQVKILAILIDFPNLKYDNNGLTASDTDMYYSSYSAAHYQGLLFAENGYEGPSGQTLMSAYQYFQQESGHSFAFTGNVQGWFTADNNADYYGGNDPDNDDSDKNVPALVLEAVTKAVANGLDLSEYDQSDFFDIDGDGNINEPDGIIDHVMIIHSSIGEEAGGGSLAEDAIWSHRFYVFDENQAPVAVPGSDIKLFGYTVTPIDAAVGVIVHEFSHDLGVDDEYDSANGTFGSPVANWSLMASGSWLGVPAGTKPSGLSPLVRDIFQTKYQGNWINQTQINFADLTNQTIDLVSSVDHVNGINQVKIELPLQQVNFGLPYTGEYQYYSNTGNMLNNSLSFNVDLPAGTSTLTMKARWDIELDYDYLQILVNDTPIAGNYTKTDNPYYAGLTHFITDKSSTIAEAEGDLAWVDLSFDLSAYENQNITIKFNYITDQLESGYGFVADNIRVTNNGSDLVFLGGEMINETTLAGFTRINDKIDGKPHGYYIQLRNHTDIDASLASVNYDAGLLLWYRNDGVSDNQVNTHPGEVFIGVVDADQNPIKQGSNFSGTNIQIRDAAFSLYDQSMMTGDEHLMANLTFDDRNDYSASYQPESGIVLPKLGLTMEVVSQANDSSNATINLAKTEIAYINAAQNGLEVNFTVTDDSSNADTVFTWQMGDGTELIGNSVTHTYNQSGHFSVTVSYQTSQGNKNLSYDLIVGNKITGDISVEKTDKTLSFSANLTGGYGSLVYRWNFGDGSDIEQKTTNTTTHTYQQVGEYTVTLSVVDDTLQTYSFTYAVTIDNALTTSFTYKTTDLAVKFTSTTSGGDENYSYLWDFGDGTTSTIANPSHTYASAGSYTVKLTVTDGNNSNVESSKTLTVSKPTIYTLPTSDKSSGGGSINFGLLALLLIWSWRKKVQRNVKSELFLQGNM